MLASPTSNYHSKPDQSESKLFTASFNLSKTKRVPRVAKYFVPENDINRDVITAHICRYLENDALVRLGRYQVS